MNNIIERYVYDVIRRLPENERDEVSKELKSNIYDMLSDNADEDEIKQVLSELGVPSLLAEKYRQKPRYLISPAIYDDYIRALKWILPLVGIILLNIGIALGIIDAVTKDAGNISGIIGGAISQGLSLAFSAVFQTLVWTTIGFAVAERTGSISEKSNVHEWKLEDLPELPSPNKHRISLSESISELVLTIVFSVIAVMIFSGIVPIAFMLQSGDTRIISFLAPEFLSACIPAIIIAAIFSIFECIVKIKYRQWIFLVCGSVIVSKLVDILVMLYLFTRPNILSEEFLGYINSSDWSKSDLYLKFMGINAGISAANPVLVIIGTIIIVSSIVPCGVAVYKTLKNYTGN